MTTPRAWPSRRSAASSGSRTRKGSCFVLPRSNRRRSSCRTGSRSSAGPKGPGSSAACTRSPSRDPDIPGQEDDEVEPFEGWLAHEMQGSGDRADATLVALAGDEVIGYAKFSLTEAQPKTAHHDLTAVKRAWRGRGIAGALKASQIRWAKTHGYEELRTSNEERNEPIRRLNARLGYRPAPGRIFLEGPLSPAP